MSNTSPAQQGGSTAPSQQPQQGSQSQGSQQQGGQQPVIRDWASI